MLLLYGYVIFFFFNWTYNIRLEKPTSENKYFWESPARKRFLSFWLFFLLPIPIIYLLPDFNLGLSEFNWLLVFFSGVISFMISFFWGKYLYDLDIFEVEQKWPLIAVFLGGCCTTYLVFPISDFINALGFDLNGSLLNDFFYCVIGIGLVEEFVKILPFLIILKFTKKINEPFDYILFAAMSSLGFSFIENTMYIHRSNFEGTTARAMISTVSHLFDTSLIAYILALNKYKRLNWGYLTLPIGFILASLAHGFYDFWLINPIAKKFALFTFIFFFISLKFWSTMVNNLINISNFFDFDKRLDNPKIMNNMMIQLTGIVSFSVLVIFLVFGSESAKDYFLITWFFNYIFFLVFVVVSLSKFVVINGYVEKLKPPYSIKELLFPTPEVNPNHTGKTLYVKVVSNYSNDDFRYKAASYFPQKCILEKRVVFIDDKDWYLAKLEKKIPMKSWTQEKVLISPSGLESFSKKGYSWIEIRAIKDESNIINGIILKKNTFSLLNAKSKIIQKPLSL